jgi:hypothetical protein
VAAVAEFTDQIGYDPVLLAVLAAGLVLEAGGPVFVAVLSRGEFEQAVQMETSSQS